MKWILTSLVTLVIGIAALVACEGNVVSLKVGDCFNGPPANSEESIDPTGDESVSCDGPHTNEVYAIFELPDSSWKDEDHVFEQAGIGCEARFEAFVGIKYELSTLYLDVLYPLEESWKMGNREAQCSVTQKSAMKVSGSAKGSRR